MSKQPAYHPSRWSPLGSRGTYAQTLLRTVGDLLIVAVTIGIIVLPVSLALAG